MRTFASASLFGFVSPYLLYLILIKNNYTLTFNCVSEYKILLPVVAVSVLALILVLNLKNFYKRLFRLGFGLILGSGLYNIGTKVFNGCVPDYINFFNISIINLADILVFTGLTMVIFSILKYNKL